jgi:small subunit ribosomal protein S8
VIRELHRVSTPGRRVYSAVKDLPQVRNGLGVSIVSTAKGVMSDARARSENVGGEVLCQVF